MAILYIFFFFLNFLKDPHLGNIYFLEQFPVAVNILPGGITIDREIGY